MQPNTAISKLMVWSRDITRDGVLPRKAAEAFVLMLSPFAPHLAEELWSRLGHQQTGKRRDEIEVPAGADEEEIRAAALASEKVQRHVGSKEPRKVILVKGRLVNVVV
jgi:leucyl-tRNA synthetase